MAKRFNNSMDPRLVSKGSSWIKANSAPVRHLVKDGEPTSELLTSGSNFSYANRSLADRAWHLEVATYAKEGWDGVLRVRMLLKDARIRLGH